MAKQKLKSRAEIAADSKWRLEDIFPSNQAWEEEFAALEKLIPEAERFKGHLADSPESLYACLKWTDDLGLRLEEVYSYARMRRDEDNREPLYQGMTDRAGALAVKVGSATSFVVPELLALEPKRFEELRRYGPLGIYEQAFEDMLRKREHVLSLAEEKLMAEIGELAEAPSTIFTMANNADLKFPEIRDAEGHEVELTKGNYLHFMESPDRRVRQEAFEGLYHTYQKQVNTWGATLNASIKADIFTAKARHYGSALEASLDDDKVPVTVYDALVETVHEFLPDMYRYVKLRKQALALDELHMYDIYVPIVPEFQMKIPYEKARTMVLTGLKPLGAEYLKALEAGFRNGWVDVYENEGKTSGAYSWGTYRSHPYVLLNHQDTLDSMFTIAHEMGHSLHTYFSNRSQPHIYAGYRIFVAEVASTLNEALVMEHLLSTTEDKKLLAYLVNHYLEQFRGTIFRQTMFAEFEKEAHALAEKGEALTADRFSEIYRGLNALYYGPDVVQDAEIAGEWARIPHFYNAFYVYKYATGFSAATALAKGILEEGQTAVERYLAFLASGSSDYPIELLRKAGVDMETPTPVREALRVFAGLVNRLEDLLNQSAG
ncbi:Oligopeptidase F [Acididesulfobacillus acetoxydans]|uniref:Oligopeptidase F n=1 Tax=Acididesulfobacillus acetoxydans TaxID=1561005 RepID=A0A8S0WN92_9FIRM|nr:oligoendopeptidase F [Acididesulfobacillus acetoxydans]CAA7601144.1 Oligopeptidase F [Acididesulfobacillus acetoxydans]CEJ08577.1 Oligoendopeptidase F homolog [Acididesulfobacillus acetoxydans]